MLTNEEAQVGEVAAGLHVDLDHSAVAFGYCLHRKHHLGFNKTMMWCYQFKVDADFPVQSIETRPHQFPHPQTISTESYPIQPPEDNLLPFVG